MYIDKTEIIHRMVESGKYYFLSRPGRFGKSLLVSTIEELFSGNQEGPGTEEDVLTFTPVVCSTLIIFMAIPWPFLHSWATWL